MIFGNRRQRWIRYFTPVGDDFGASCHERATNGPIEKAGNVPLDWNQCLPVIEPAEPRHGFEKIDRIRVLGI